jgi:DNA-binding response OmpR family regulator
MDIVIIEDEIEIAHLIEQTLERESFTCHLAYNGRVGLELFYQKQPDLVILDLMVKPFSPRELTARVRALLRRSLRHDSQPQQLHRSRHFLIDLDQHSALRKLEGMPEETLDLTTLEFNLLATFVSYPNRVWSRTQLIDNLWGNDFFGDERVVDTHIRRLRKKVEPDPANPIFIKTVVGVGYKFEDDII